MYAVMSGRTPPASADHVSPVEGITSSVPQTSTTLERSILEGHNLVKTLNNFAHFSDRFPLYLQNAEYINIQILFKLLNKYPLIDDHV
jgi:hypothetical protein